MKAVGWRMVMLLVVSLVFLSGCYEDKVSYPMRTMPDGLQTDVAQIEQGKELFMRKCAHCHGKPSEGRSDRANFFKPAAPNFTDVHYRDLDPAFLYWRIEVGKTVDPYLSQGSVMPAWGSYFSETQIWQIVAYLRARAH